MTSELWRAVILGVIQGVTEFLPISSKGHLVIFGAILEQWFGKSTPEAELQLIIALHLGTLVSIAVVFWRELWELPTRPRLCLWIVVATIPAALTGMLFEKTLEKTFTSPLIASGGLVVTAAMLWFSQRFHRDERSLEQLRLKDAVTVGLFQTMALIPGISRSGSTISGGLLSGLSGEAAARFSFLIALPIVAGVSAKKLGPLVINTLRGYPTGEAAPHLLPFVAGAVVSCLVGIISLNLLLRVLVRRQMHWFALYCLAAAIAIATWQLAR